MANFDWHTSLSYAYACMLLHILSLLDFTNFPFVGNIKQKFQMI